ncbi:MAG: radical SAM protein [Chloroflexota bacterium]|nr:radical SAM protein [Chloroflexota bacterium]
MPADKNNGEKLTDYAFELGPIRPPSEGQDSSLLIRATRNCPWNKCQFCSAYRDQRFEYRGVAQVKRDIDVIKALSDEMKSASWRLGYSGSVTNEVLTLMVQGNPQIYGRAFVEPEVLTARFHSLSNVANWLHSGAKTVFLQDANSLIIRTPELVEVIRYLKETFPTIERVTSYARSKTTARKSLEELQELHEAGLSRLHVGLESGYDEVLKYVQKGVTAEEHIRGGKKVVESGISLSEYVMPGLGGRRWSKTHALETARVLNQIDAAFIRIRSLIVRRGTPLYDKQESGEFEQPTEDEVVDEIRLFIENLDCNSYVASDQMSNLLWEIEGKLPEDKEAMLKTINEYQTMPPVERLKVKLERRLRSYLAVYGILDGSLEEKVQQASESLRKGSSDMTLRVDEAISALKGSFV